MNKGEENEILIQKELNEKIFNDLNDNWKNNIKLIFPNIQDTDMVKCKLLQERFKPDISITINGETKFVSIKSGDYVSAHEESLVTFKDFLSSLGVSKRTLKILAFYHYGGSVDGTNEIKMSGVELQQKYGVYIKQASVELNQDNIITEVVNRVIIKGCRTDYPKIDYLYYGGPNFGYLVSAQEILDYALYNRRMYLSCIHIGPFTYQPAMRHQNTIRAEKRRHNSQIKWPTITFDMSRIIEKRNK